MNDIENLQSIFHIYEERYNKAKAMGINEGSKFYTAMKEIECRYITLYYAIEMINSLKNKCNERGFRKYCFDFFQIIAKEIVPYEIIIDENGKKEYIAQKVKVSKQNVYAIEVYKKAKQAYISFQEMNYEENDKNTVCTKISKNILYMLHWMMIVREIRFPVNQGKYDMICNM